MRIRSPRSYLDERLAEHMSRIATGQIANERALGHFRGFMEPGDLVFDVGANLGERTALFRALGAKVVAVDPQPSSVAALNSRFAGDAGVKVIDRAVAAAPGTYTLRVDENHTLSTMSPEWIAALAESGRFDGADWSKSIEVEGTTLDALIEEFGVPQFCKIDVEGYEPEVLAGLSRPLPAASFEFAAEAVERAVTCVSRFASLGPCEFALTYAESMMLGRWEGATNLIPRLRSFPDPLTWGDCYVRSTPNAG